MAKSKLDRHKPKEGSRGSNTNGNKTPVEQGPRTQLPPLRSRRRRSFPGIGGGVPAAEPVRTQETPRILLGSLSPWKPPETSLCDVCRI